MSTDDDTPPSARATQAVAPRGQHPLPPALSACGPLVTAYPQPYEDATAAWLLWSSLGHWGAHDSHLRRTGAGAGKAVLALVGLLRVWSLVSTASLVAVFVWWVVDACTTTGRLQEVNGQVHVHDRALGAVR